MRPLGDDNVGNVVIATSDLGDGNRELATRGVPLLRMGSLSPEAIAPSRVVVVLRLDLGSRISGLEVGDDVGPRLVVVDSHTEEEVGAVFGFEANRAGGSAAAHLQDVLAVECGPGTSVGVLPDGLFDDVAPFVARLADAYGNRVGHIRICQGVSEVDLWARGTARAYSRIRSCSMRRRDRRVCVSEA